MRRMICLLTALTMWAAIAEEDLREWKSKTGTTIEASFVKEEKGVVSLKRKDGVTIQAKLDALSDEDREYVLDLTYVPQTVKAVFRRDRSGYNFVETGTSANVTARDTAMLMVDSAVLDAPPNVKGDTSWKIESVDALGNRILPRREGMGEELKTDGKFVFLTYRVSNDSLAPVDVPSPMLHDQHGRTFTQTERSMAQHYTPEGTLFAGRDMLQPGFTKLYCAFYELPPNAEPAIVEVFPSPAKAAMMRQLQLNGIRPTGKKIMLGASVAEPQPKPPQASPANETAPAADDKTPLFVRCSRLGQSGDSNNTWYYDRTRKRSLTYGIEMRPLGDQAMKVKVKAFFIGEATGSRDLVLDTKETEVSLEPGKIARAALQSEEIEEQTYSSYYYGNQRIRGAKLKGVVIQVWADSKLLHGWASQNQWRKFAENLDVPGEMGEAKKSTGGY